jgi:PAS domain S-box-containing protein
MRMDSLLAGANRRDCLFDLSSDFLAAISDQGQCQCANATLCRRLGWTLDELQACPFRQRFHPDDIGSFVDALTGKSGSLSSRLRCKDGSYCWIDWKLTSFPEDGVVYLVGREVPPAVIASPGEDTLQRRLYETILSNTPDLVYVFDVNHRFTYANQALLTMWGKTWEEAAGRNCLELGYEPWHAAMHDREIEEVIATRKPIRGQVPFTGTHGRRIYDYIFVPVVGVDGEVEAIAGTTRDLTEQKRIEEELRRANRNLEQFAYSATHDLQEPLRTMKIYGELLTARYYDRLEGTGLQYLKFIHTGATRMEMLVRDLLNYTQASTLEKPADYVDAGQCLSNALASLTAAIGECDARVSTDDLPSVPVHAAHLHQLFLNIVGNAVKYRRRGIEPQIQISATRENSHWLFAVRDNGIGIARDYHERIFGIFKRLHTSQEYTGTGIGLALCLRIVEHYQGRIWVESELGEGSTFFFTLPA